MGPRPDALLGFSAALLLAAPAAAEWAFTDVTAAAGVGAPHSLDHRLTPAREIIGGAAVGDYDGDGWVDIYSLGGNLSANSLFRNNGDGTFTDHAAAAGVDLPGTLGNGAIFADWDGDGDLDLFVGGIETTEAVMFRNEGDGTFTDVTAASGVVLPQDTFSGSFADYDRDGDLDLFAAHWFVSPRQTGHVWRNNGDGTFTDVDSLAGYVDFPPYAPSVGDNSFAYNLADLDSDGDPDLVCAADFRTSHHFRNDDGTFVNVTDPGVIIDENGMGTCIGDYDNDGDLDWFVTSIYGPTVPPFKVGNRLYVNDGNGVLSDGTAAAGVADGGWGWAASFQDFNNDGWLDIFHVNGWRPAYTFNKSRMFVNAGDGTFDELAFPLGCADTGEGRGVCCFDYDRDGDIDIYIANNDQPATLLRNDGLTNHWLDVSLSGAAPNTQEVGARVRVTANGITQLRELLCGSNFLSNDPVTAHFGLGAADTADVVEIEWTNGAVTVLTDVPADQELQLPQPGLEDPTLVPEPTAASAISILGAAPNPFRTGTTLRFALPVAGPVTVRVFDAAGRRVRTLADGARGRGEHAVTWNGRDDRGRPVASGVYWYEVRSGAARAQGRLARLR
ncbi:MAG TPA: FG-GAP-like repeat-containing protein [bacterium]|nr:FG-GAP-like repeat-containing protein [bacterium]